MLRTTCETIGILSHLLLSSSTARGSAALPLVAMKVTVHLLCIVVSLGCSSYDLEKDGGCFWGCEVGGRGG